MRGFIRGAGMGLMVAVIASHFNFNLWETWFMFIGAFLLLITERE